MENKNNVTCGSTPCTDFKPYSEWCGMCKECERKR